MQLYVQTQNLKSNKTGKKWGRLLQEKIFFSLSALDFLLKLAHAFKLPFLDFILFIVAGNTTQIKKISMQ